MSSTPINLVYEDVLRGAVLDKILAHVEADYVVGLRLSKNGFGYIKKNIRGFNKAAQGSPYLVLTDLDQTDCPITLIQDWLGGQPKHPNLLFRIAVREVESWLLADRRAFSDFFAVDLAKVPQNPDLVDDPKRDLINLVRTSKQKDLRQAIVPEQGSTAKVGKDYNAPLLKFISQPWRVREAMNQSKSLQRTVFALEAFQF
ncbi:MAG: hypothetical protein R6U67_15180 [Sodalinema sp.]|uniref:hypothetical protein n=1 Tax=Sodalinema sp. TaxID=3080550 RepID=UPI00396F685A